MTDRHLYTNRLIKEKSPYLLQHAHNPVDWYAWGDEAFSAARTQDKPIFLSIGYATCHWCHVMERESFEDVEVAQLLNETFINIKVDREELSEVDNLYMEFAQSMMAGAAGWPLNVIITPDLQPFFATTYLPPHSRHGFMGLVELIMRIKEVWAGEEREQVVQEAAKIVEVFEQSSEAVGDQLPEMEQVDDNAEILFKMADSIYGGMKGVPKFPIGYQYSFMLRYSSIHQDSRAIFFVEKTLDMLQRGGIYDHLGGGFSRYSVDEKWLIPHFEKMLYDNALLAQSYMEAWQATKNPLYRKICLETLNYVLRDMTHPEGGFYSAEDADSEGREGYFYTWTKEEIIDLLGMEEGEIFCELFGVTEEGNFEGRNILNTPVELEEYAQQTDQDPFQLLELFEAQKKVLWTAREKRVHPFKDDKVLCSWNGLMIHTMACAGRALQEPRYVAAAIQAAQFILDKLWTPNGLMRRYRDGEANFRAGVDDYAFLIRAFITLFETGCGSKWLEWALRFNSILQRDFKEPGGAYYQTDGQDPSIIIRKCHFADGAEPSGNSVHAENLLRFYQLSFYPEFLEHASDVLKSSRKYLDSYSPGYCYQMMNLNRFYDKHATTVVVALDKNESYYQELLHLFFNQFIPHADIIWRREDDQQLFSLNPSMREYPSIKGKTTLYLCREGVCQEPVTELPEMLQAIHEL